MSESLTIDQVVAILTKVAEDLEGARDRLNELDGAIGDGDHGISVARGFRALQEGLAKHPPDIGRTLAEAGLQFNEGAGATVGALLGTAFMRAGKEVRGQSEISLADVVRMAKAAGQGVQERGKAEPGHKTMLDAIVPATEALEKAAAAGASLEEAVDQAVAAAEGGVEATKDMLPGYGRARWLGERTLGHQDAGATTVYLMLKSVAERLYRA
ncbi:MAG: dihydroxyacetone kinase subunit DhaL [Dehalococcoidales bacterium]|nr:dihydroxyacetone kinase subunit DhaL [Dehalococcoidales bacterium]